MQYEMHMYSYGIDPYNTRINNVRLVRSEDLYDKDHNKIGYILIYKAESPDIKDTIMIMSMYRINDLLIIITTSKNPRKEGKDIGYSGLLVHFIKDLILAPLYT